MAHSTKTLNIMAVKLLGFTVCTYPTHRQHNSDFTIVSTTIIQRIYFVLLVKNT